MFDIGLQELIVIFVVALLVIGPDKLPEFSRKLGKWVNEIKRVIHEEKQRIDDEFSEQVKKPEEVVKSVTKKDKTEENNSEPDIKEGKL